MYSFQHHENQRRYSYVIAAQGTEDYTGKGCDGIPLIVPSVPLSLRYAVMATHRGWCNVPELEGGEDIDRDSFYFYYTANLMIITQIIFSNNNGPRIPELTKDDSFFEKSLT